MSDNLRFKLIDNKDQIDKKEENTIYLIHHNFDDYGYCTGFTLYIFMDYEIIHLGYIKISCINLSHKVEADLSQNGFNSYSIKSLIPTGFFSKLPDEFFSLGTDISYYKKLVESFDKKMLFEILSATRDLAGDLNRFNQLYEKGESSLINSLLRELHYTNVEQFNRIIMGEAELTPYNIKFSYQEEMYEIDVTPNSLPPSNIHILIGRNGVGKTWLLYHMLYNILNNMNVSLSSKQSDKYTLDPKFQLLNNTETFAGAIGISFSLFDDAFSSIAFDSVMDKDKVDKDSLKYKRLKNEFDKKYKYIGLISKNQKNGQLKTKSVDNLCEEFIISLDIIKKDEYKVDTYTQMCESLHTDPMFSDNEFISILQKYIKGDEQMQNVIKYLKRLSSGHMIIILSLTLLCNSIFEKTIVLIDEPETHLHPPLLSTYIRTLSYILRQKNAVGIIATHSPIVLQEVPRSCVMKIERTQGDMSFCRPHIETFATNTDSITREIFGYEIGKTGFYKLINDEISNDFDSTLKKFNGQVGFLGQIHIQRLVNLGGGDNEKD